MMKNLRALTQDDGYDIDNDKVIPDTKLLDAVDSLKNHLPSLSSDELTAVGGLTELFDKFRYAKSDKLEIQIRGDFVFSESVRRALRDLLLRSIAIEEREIGFVFSDHYEGGRFFTRTLLVAVVGRETMDAVSPGNLLVGSNKVKVLDPRRVAEVLIRAAYLVSQDDHRSITNTIIMAQMPHTEAEELGSHMKADFIAWQPFIGGPYPVNLILSEAQAEHASPIFDTEYRDEEMIPILTPQPAFDRIKHGLVKPRSLVHIRSMGQARHLSNWISTEMMPTFGAPRTTLDLLKDELTRNKRVHSNLLDTSAIDFLLHEIQVSSHADVVFLERRDLYLDRLPAEYADYDDICPLGTKAQQASRLPSLQLTPDDVAACRLHVALDRILWKGDFSQRVLVTGKDLKDALKAAGDQAVAQRSLAARDTRDQWLVTFGVVTNDPANLTRLESSNDRFGVPWSDECGTTKKQKDPQYCVNGSTIADDAGYWVSTSDHIANDTAIYTILEPLPIERLRARPCNTSSKIDH